MDPWPLLENPIPNRSLAMLKLMLGLAMEREVVIQWSNSFSSWNGVSEFSTALELVVSGRVNPGPIVTHHFGLDEIGEAFSVADDKRASGAIRVMVRPWG